MSGGHFNYEQYHIGQIAAEIEHMIEINDSTEKDKYGYDIGYHYTEETVAKFRAAVTVLRQAEIMAQRIDWLVSGDDGEDSFHRRWDEDLEQL